MKIMSIDNLLEMAYKLDIRVCFRYLNDGNKKRLLYAITVSKTNTIIMDNSLFDNLARLKCILAEEIGHILHPPRPGHVSFHSRGFWLTEGTSCIKAIVAQDERKALDWATSVLMPDVEFDLIMENGCFSIVEIAELFEVEQWFILHKIGYYRRKQRDVGCRVRWRELIKRV